MCIYVCVCVCVRERERERDRERDRERQRERERVNTAIYTLYCDRQRWNGCTEDICLSIRITQINNKPL